MIKEKFKTVKTILEGFPNSRDSDRKLIANFWLREMQGTEGTTDSTFNFLLNFAQGNYSLPESITRARRLVQEMHPELRGNRYEGRKRLEVETKVEIIEIKTDDLHEEKIFDDNFFGCHALNS